MLASRAVMIGFCSLLINKLPLCKCSWRLLRPRTRDPTAAAGASGSSADSAAGRPSDDDNGKADEERKFVPFKTQFILWFAGLRGGISFALVEVRVRAKRSVKKCRD